MRKFLFVLVSTAAVGFGGIAAGHAMPLGAAGNAVKDAADATDHVDQIALYVVRGQRYCFYFDGWHGAGWYRCGYAWRRGLGWGGVYGWQGWEYGPAARRFGRAGVSVRESSRTTVRDRGSISTREGANVRDRATVRGETSGRAGSDGASVRSRSGVSGETTGRASRDGGGEVRSGVSGGGSAGGEVRRSPGGGGAAVEGGGAVRGGGGATGGGEPREAVAAWAAKVAVALPAEAAETAADNVEGLVVTEPRACRGSFSRLHAGPGSIRDRRAGIPRAPAVRAPAP
jgi:hypothetical protein